MAVGVLVPSAMKALVPSTMKATPPRRLFASIAAAPHHHRRRLASTLAVRSPVDGRAFAEIADNSVGEVDAAVAAAKDLARSPWAHADAVNERASSLRALGAALRRDKEPLAKLETLDCGKTISESRVDMDACADLCDYYADITPSVLQAESEIALPDADFGSRVVAAPVGVVAAVTPWNYPLMQAVVKVAPALAAGCPVVLKPSPLASLTCLELGKLATEAGLPAGALTVLTGGPPNGASDAGAARLLSHPAVDYLSFTGSTRGGKEMLRSSAELVRPTGMELGGKGAMVVFGDAEVASVVDWAMVGIFCTAGQICSATSRLLVHSSIKADVIDALHAAATNLKMGDPLDESTQMGALISEGAKANVLSHVARAQEDGATLLCGGAKPAGLSDAIDGGYYVAPTVLTDVPFESAAWREEIFGPVLCVQTFETEEEAVKLANDSPYGLAHAVMSADEQRCERVASRLDAGTVWINCSQPLWPQTPFGGWKASGFGKEWGEAGLHEYLRHKTITRTKAGSAFSWGYFGSA